MGRKLVQTDQGYQSIATTPDRFGHVQAKILTTFQKRLQPPPLKKNSHFVRNNFHRGCLISLPLLVVCWTYMF